MIQSSMVNSSATSWEHFVKIKNEARARTNAASQVKNVAATTKKFEINQAIPNNASVKLVKQMGVMAGEPNVKTKILGGMFDAYA
jgi:hypothetical protein